MVSRPPKARSSSAAAGRSFWRLPKLNPRNPVHLTLKLRGGAEGWVEIHSRGSVTRVPGHTAVYDVLMQITSNS